MIRRSAPAPRIVELVGMVWLLLEASGVQATGLHGVGDGWLLAPREIREVLGCGIESVQPAESSGVWASAAVMRLYGMPELPADRIAVGFRVRRAGTAVQVGASRETLGTELVRESQSGIGLHFGEETGFGVEWCEEDLVIAGERADHRHSWRWVLRTGWWLEAVRVRMRCWLEPVLETRPRPRSLLSLSTLLPRVGLAAAFRVEQRTDQELGLANETTLALNSHLAIGLRYESLTGSMGPVTAWSLGHLMVLTSHVTHPELGITHRFRIVFGNPGMEAP